MEKESVKKEINDAFERSVYPGDQNIAINKKDLEYEHLKDFIGVNWHQITVDFIVPKHTSSLCFMTPLAFCYYMPAYMSISVENYVESDIVPDNLVHALTIRTQCDLDKLNTIKEHLGANNSSLGDVDEEVVWFYERINNFTHRQKNTICKYLLFLIQEHSADYPDNAPQIAIDRYWKFFMEK